LGAQMRHHEGPIRGRLQTMKRSRGAALSDWTFVKRNHMPTVLTPSPTEPTRRGAPWPILTRLR